MVVVRFACRINGLTGLAITRLDVLGGLDKIKICTAYELDGKEIQNFPSTLKTLARGKPVHVELDGWAELEDEKWMEIAQTGYEALPPDLTKYANYMSEITNVPLKIISIGPGREATIHL
jgi:adenylosuccinate synthase